jgi:hypothetical protein
MSIKVVDIFRRVGEVLHDKAHDRWSLEELLDWLNDAQHEIVMQRPDANVVTEEFYTVEHSSKQDLPSSGLRLIDIVRNIGGSNEPITLFDRKTLDTTVPNWHNSDPTYDIENYVYDERNPKVFYLYPRPDFDAIIEIVYSTAPKQIAIDDYEDINESIFWMIFIKTRSSTTSCTAVTRRIPRFRI